MGADGRTVLDVAGIERRIIAFVQRELLAPDTTVGRNDDLLSGSLLDSLGLLRLAAFVEEEYRFAMPPQDFVVDNFRSVAALAGYVRNAASGGPHGDAEP